MECVIRLTPHVCLHAGLLYLSRSDPIEPCFEARLQRAACLRQNGQSVLYENSAKFPLDLSPVVVSYGWYEGESGWKEAHSCRRHGHRRKIKSIVSVASLCSTAIASAYLKEKGHFCRPCILNDPSSSVTIGMDINFGFYCMLGHGFVLAQGIIIIFFLTTEPSSQRISVCWGETWSKILMELLPVQMMMWEGECFSITAQVIKERHTSDRGSKGRKRERERERM